MPRLPRRSHSKGMDDKEDAISAAEVNTQPASLAYVVKTSNRPADLDYVASQDNESYGEWRRLGLKKAKNLATIQNQPFRPPGRTLFLPVNRKNCLTDNDKTT